jgi:uncharacterized protein
VSWLEEMFGVSKPIIAMLHLMALPGDPAFDTQAGMSRVVDRARRELEALQEGGVDGLMISNEFSLPYLTQTEPVTGMAMARIIGEMYDEITLPFGVNVLWDGCASLDLAAATSAAFVREIFTGVYASDFGLWNTDIGRTSRHRTRLGIPDTKMLFNLLPEAAKYVADRSLADITRSTVFNALPDAIVVSGLTAGAPTANSALRTVKDNAGDVPVLVNTGLRPETVTEQLSIADGGVVGTALKHNGRFEEEATLEQVHRLMTAVHAFRGPIGRSVQSAV